MRVLLIEDDSATAQSIELMLKSESFNVYTTDLGEEGVDLGKLYDYDIILLDLNLPDMSGYEVLRTLRVAKVQTPILILSGLAGIEDKVRGLGFGADDYMTKPFHKDELVARIHAIVRRSKGHAQSVITTGDLVVNLDAKTVEVEQDDVVIIQLAQVQAFLAEIGLVDIESFGREHQLDRLGRGRLVLDQKYAHGWSPLKPQPGSLARRGAAPS